jgi:SAM-dependent methyltransferase
MTFDAAAYKLAITQEWGRAASGWHRWRPTINSWLERATGIMLDEAGVKEGCGVIDIAAGDGGQSVAAAQLVGPKGKVMATDITPEFVKLADAVASKMGLTQLSAKRMDAESLAVPDEAYDAAISRLGLMYLPNLSKGLSEINRVLRPRGRVAAVVFTTAEKTPFFSIPVSLIRERRGLPPPEAGQPGPFALGTPGKLAQHFADAGFRGIREQIVEAPLRFASTKECVRWRREASGTMQQMLDGLDVDQQAKIWEEIEEALCRFETASGFVSPCELLICSASKE